ncbi:hypothetical protein BBO99_00008590 [Phytophthora kernoviae]|uniref:Uncharacterized protein n=1 Tax=Phytophthora kernoviae TaxID=325452 RepID=A0A3R7JPN5_9STRA|nr:hypothetical protein BBI17_008603 [Phytophthora kernoviae]RLN75108.1 hypothetical protein BBO99_00008590 [Phytophthora kernoviae]
MANELEDTLQEAALAQFLRECEPPTPPSSAASKVSPEFSRVTLGSGKSLISHDGLKSSTGNFQIEEGSGVPQFIMDKTDFSTPEQVSEFKLSVQRAKANKRRTRHRQRVKVEWQMLRLQNDKLSARLQELKRARGCVGITGMSQLKWQALATKELSARLQAEGEQQHLRMEIERRAGTIQKLEGLWSQYITNDEEPQQEWGPDDFELYKNFIFEVGMAYARTDTVLHDSGLGEAVPSSASYYTPTRKRDALRGFEYFESTSSIVIPSKYPKTANAMFDSMRQVHRQNPRRQLHEVVEDFPNTIAVKVGTISHCESGNIVPLSMILTMQRFVEPGRTILVWRGLVESGGEFAGTYLSHTGWCVLKPSAPDASGVVNSTDVRTCVHTVPTHLRPTKAIEGSDNAPDIRRIVDISMRSAQSDKLKLARLMAKLLLED